MKLRDLIPFVRPSAVENVEKSVAQTSEGGIPTTWDLGWWQQGKSPLRYDSSVNSTVEACVSALAQTSAMCPLHHIVDNDEKGEQRKKGSNLERVMLNPNNYQTRSLFMVNAIRSMYFTGDAYAVADRNEAGTIRAIHLFDPLSTKAYPDPETGMVFYYATPYSNQPIEEFKYESDRIFASRDVMHLRLYTGRNPLKGETPIQAAVNAISANNLITQHQNTFFSNMSRPSGTLATEMKLNAEEMNFLRQKWKEQSTDINSGGIPILSNGLKFESMSLSSQDAQLVEAYGLTVADISRAFRVPLVLINDMSGATFNNAEQTMGFFLMSGLGFLLDHVELSIARLFDLPFGESVNFDTNVLLRTDFATRMKGLGDAIQRGVYSPNEARRKEKLPDVEGGEEPRVQKQVVPLSAYEREQAFLEDQANKPEPETESTPEEEEEVLLDEEQDEGAEADEEKLLLSMRDEYQRTIYNAA